MQEYVTDSRIVNCSKSIKKLRRDGCGLINCRPRRMRGQSVHNEIQAILDARSIGAHWDAKVQNTV